ncbi:ribosome maturation factor RimM [Treponema parvum]|uniref:ribosome maturation factor RimM n=1 Tax=Treponema parvum TaxID=138851 RepID=UPI001AEBE47E|nr:ribosome maturation factor RimM [Treponema parvum]QTQ16598.1 16S rRNA processing protein RimM [Treponema parvum]
MLEQVTVGFVRGAHGVTGEFRVESASGEFEHILVLREVTLRGSGEQKIFKVEYVKPADSTLYMKLAGIDSPDDVRKYNRWEIVVPRKYAAPLNKNEWYIDDLKQCSLVYFAENKDGLKDKSASAVKVGTVTDVLEGGGGYLFEVSISENCDLLSKDIRYTASGKSRSVFVPFNYEHIRNVDVKRKEIELMHLWILE